MARVRLLVLAQRNLRDLCHHAVFGEEWNRALVRLATLPHNSHVYEFDGRPGYRLLLQRSQYHIYYRVDDLKNEVVIYEIRSTRQKPR